ncbi:MAG: carbon monoxide dehydrogenase subunit G [Gammaproteobacteria bacterium]|nr:carbon monoxide dehydrogenase subunit G [Gammaproteobacteria bacterium]
MKLESNRVIQAEPGVVWEHLVDVEVLKQCIPGCQTMEQTGENEYALTMKSKVGPVSATFKGELSLRDIVPGESYTLHFEGKGGAAGFGKGSAAVRLEPADEGTNLIYSVDASVGGKIAQVGQRLVDGTARKMADDFFSQFEQVVAPAEAGDGFEPAADTARKISRGGGESSSESSGRTWMWIGGGIIVLLIILLLWGAV